MSLLTKRDDIQCWRALSIVAVMLFHIWPEKFPNGFIGVDIFFVISGYLMACLYSFKSNIFLSTLEFYGRRIRRLLPIYLLHILITLLMLHKQVLQEDYALIVEDSKWAIALASNYQGVLKKKAYFDIEAQFRFFRHCWSLAVEMQFYLIFPLIAFFRAHISLIKYQFLLMTLFFGSLLYQNFSKNPIIQYQSLFCRIWQFCIGMLVQTLPVLSIKGLPAFLLLILTILLFWMSSFPRLIISFITVVISGGIISMSTSKCHPFKSLIRSSKALNYFIILGNISYVLYLIHWPLITFAKFISPANKFSYFDGFLLLTTSILLSQFVHTIIEKPLTKFCTNHVNLVVFLIILSSSAVYVPKHLPKQSNIKSNLTLTFWQKMIDLSTPLKMPPKWTKENDIEVAVKLRGEHMGGAFICNERKTIQLNNLTLYYCEVLGNPNGTLVALSIGNSFSMNILPALSSNSLFKKVINVFGNGQPFPNHDELETYALHELIKVIKPDVTLIIQHYFQKYLFDTSLEDISKHREFSHWNNILKEIERYTSAIIINKEQIVYPHDISKDYIRRKFYGLPLQSSLQNPLPSPTLEAWLTSLNCSKCQFFNYREAFCDGGHCKTLDLGSGLPVFRDTTHISPIGTRHLKPFIDKAINKALNISLNNLKRC